MRITTQMLNETAKRTGIPVNQTSLLNYINSDDASSSGGSTLLDALNKNSKVSAASAAEHAKLQKSADSLKEQAEKLAESGEDSFFEKIKAGGSRQELYSAVDSYVSSYNSTLSALRRSDSALNQYYAKMMREAASENSEKLKKIGITAAEDGTLSLDQESFHSATAEDIESVFGASGGFSVKTAFLAGKVSDNAQAGIEGISSRYGADGALYSQLASRYDFWG